MAQAESGNIKLQRGEPWLTGIVSNAMEAVKAGAQQKRIRFEVWTENDDQQVRADGDQAFWVLVNLLSNAIRHSPADGVVIIASCPKDGWQEVTVADQGPRIPADQQQRMIHRFAKGATVSQGKGLGLSIAREFILAMGGSITHDPISRAGASFTLRFRSAQ